MIPTLVAILTVVAGLYDSGQIMPLRPGVFIGIRPNHRGSVDGRIGVRALGFIAAEVTEPVDVSVLLKPIGSGNLFISCIAAIIADRINFLGGAGQIVAAIAVGGGQFRGGIVDLPVGIMMIAGGLMAAFVADGLIFPYDVRLGFGIGFGRGGLPDIAAGIAIPGLALLSGDAVPGVPQIFVHRIAGECFPDNGFVGMGAGSHGGRNIAAVEAVAVIQIVMGLPFAEQLTGRFTVPFVGASVAVVIVL